MKGPCTVDGCDSLTIARGLCNRHYLRWKVHGDPTAPRAIPPQCQAVDPVQRFWSYVDKTDSCWLWTGGLFSAGYGSFSPSHDVRTHAHLYSYKLLVGPIPEGLQLDHLCHDPRVCRLGSDCPHRRCVNPAHLEPVTAHENMMRSGAPSAVCARTGTCMKGHPFTPENTYYYKSGSRVCRTCRRDWEREYRLHYVRPKRVRGATQGVDGGQELAPRMAY